MITINDYGNLIQIVEYYNKEYELIIWGVAVKVGCIKDDFESLFFAY